MRPARQRNNTSGYRGVTWHALGKAWQARIKVDGKLIHLGLFEEIEFASDVYEAAVRLIEKQKGERYEAR